MLFERQVRAALVERDVFADEISLGEARLDISELVGLLPVDVALHAVLVDARLGRRQRFLNRADTLERLVFHLDQLQGLGGCIFVHGRHGHNRIAHHAHSFDLQRVLILAHR